VWLLRQAADPSRRGALVSRKSSGSDEPKLDL